MSSEHSIRPAADHLAATARQVRRSAIVRRGRAAVASLARIRSIGSNAPMGEDQSVLAGLSALRAAGLESPGAIERL